ncbi:lysozyme-like [Zootermopsis nevadensis]|uniref:lysozyme n=1 Tax=Zootermopsis nevadensis TaxID=136037 RepID=A0A067RKT7_ZOONE|nr:lysozyme-like [Zootermopsis nevadensis]KDR20128.1 Lysozyme [Zootermopsis nevadensis]
MSAWRAGQGRPGPQSCSAGMRDGCSIVLLLLATSGYAVFVTNLHAACFRCLCHAANECSTNRACSMGYCGPFSISHIYWADAGRHVLPDDHPNPKEAYETCVQDYDCATNTVTGYMEKYGRDCNGDGVTNCDDYVMIHYNGGGSCEKPITDKLYKKRYNSCRAAAIAVD